MGLFVIDQPSDRNFVDNSGQGGQAVQVHKCPACIPFLSPIVRADVLHRINLSTEFYLHLFPKIHCSRKMNVEFAGDPPSVCAMLALIKSRVMFNACREPTNSNYSLSIAFSLTMMTMRARRRVTFNLKQHDKMTMSSANRNNNDNSTTGRASSPPLSGSNGLCDYAGLEFSRRWSLAQGERKKSRNHLHAKLHERILVWNGGWYARWDKFETKGQLRHLKLIGTSLLTLSSGRGGQNNRLIKILTRKTMRDGGGWWYDWQTGTATGGETEQNFCDEGRAFHIKYRFSWCIPFSSRTDADATAHKYATITGGRLVVNVSQTQSEELGESSVILLEGVIIHRFGIWKSRFIMLWKGPKLATDHKFYEDSKGVQLCIET